MTQKVKLSTTVNENGTYSVWRDGIEILNTDNKRLASRTYHDEIDKATNFGEKYWLLEGNQ